MAHLNTYREGAARGRFIFMFRNFCMRLQYEAVSVCMCLSVQLIDWWLIQGHVSEVFGPRPPWSSDHWFPLIRKSQALLDSIKLLDNRPYIPLVTGTLPECDNVKGHCEMHLLFCVCVSFHRLCAFLNVNVDTCPCYQPVARKESLFIRYFRWSSLNHSPHLLSDHSWLFCACYDH